MITNDQSTSTDQAAEPYLRGTTNGRFHANKEFADAINAGTVLHELPYRGEITQVVTTELGPFGRTSFFGVLRETWFGDGASQWVAFPSTGAALAWSRTTVAHWLATHSGAENSQHFAVWRGTGWIVEIDRHRQRYTAAVGYAPGTAVECYHALNDASEDEPRSVTEARGWARLTELLPVSPDGWPWSMANEYERVLAAHSKLTAEQDVAPAEAELPITLPAPSAVIPASPWMRLWRWITTRFAR